MVIIKSSIVINFSLSKLNRYSFKYARGLKNPSIDTVDRHNIKHANIAENTNHKWVKTNIALKIHETKIPQKLNKNKFIKTEANKIRSSIFQPNDH